MYNYIRKEINKTTKEEITITNAKTKREIETINENIPQDTIVEIKSITKIITIDYELKNNKQETSLNTESYTNLVSRTILYNGIEYDITGLKNPLPFYFEKI